MSKVSIIVPVYNAAPYLRQCCDSLLMQTYWDTEIILVDDGSTDGSGIICDEYAQKNFSNYKGCIQVFHIQNAGAGAARKFGVSKATGEWVMFVDSDDTVTQDGLALLMSKCSENVDLVAGSINKNGHLFAHQVTGLLLPEEYVVALLKGETTDGPVAKVIRRSLFDNLSWDIPREIIQNEDLLMLVTLATKMRQALISSDIVCYEYHERSGTASSRKMAFEVWKALFNRLEALLPDTQRAKVAFCQYRLNRLYRNVILKGETISPKDSYVQTFIKESEGYEFEAARRKIIRLLKQPPIRQRLENAVNKCMKTKRFIQIILEKL